MSPDGESSLLFRRVGRRVSRSSLRSFSGVLRDRVAAGRPFTCLLTDDSELRRLNRQFLSKDYPTDVLSFPALDPEVHLGELAISVDRAAEQAARYGHSIDEEIRILMLHGVLHLLGMDHERDRGSMRRAELRWRKELGLPSGLIERALT